ncbi:MAG: hypothetical protein FWB90_08390 [Fibromonadales bacterium]|nr:hypothetical protein [Fibromonadales bacterium]
MVIRFATQLDADKIMKAINDHWDSCHILAHNKDFFLYYFNGDDKHINMVIGEEQETGEIAGFLGYKKYNSADCSDIAIILWKIVDGKASSLGINLLFFLFQNIKYALSSGIGVNPKTALPIYKSLKYQVGLLEHYYRISDRDEYKIAKIADKRILPLPATDSGWDILHIPDFEMFSEKIDDSLLKERYPHKDKCYFNNYFFAHPVFSYKIYGITEKSADAMPALFVCREVEKFGAKILRIVDYIGEEIYFSYLSLSLQKLMYDNDYEYIDCYCIGMSEKAMNGAGFILRKEDDPNIIPNHFEPFVCKNIDIYYSTNKIDKFRAFRADGDQDKPRLYDRNLTQAKEKSNG